MMIPMRRILSALAAGLGVILFVQSAWAQTAPPSLEEVVVTARRRDETFQSVPITVNRVYGASRSSRRESKIPATLWQWCRT